MLIIRGLADSLYGGCLIQRAARQANYSPYYKKSATVGVNYSLTITLSMVLKGSIGVDAGGRHLLVGDALDNWISPAAGHLYTDRGSLVRSAERISRMGERTLYYGHGKPTGNKFRFLKN